MLAQLAELSPDDLEAARRQIVASANGDYKTLSEDDLARLAYITSTLRRRASGPPKAAKDKATGSVKKAKPTLDDLGGLL